LLTASQLALMAYALHYPVQHTHIGGEMMLLAFLTATTGLVMMVAALEARRGGMLSLLAPSGHYASAPKLAMLMLLFGLIATGLPLSLGYMAEEMILGGTFDAEPLAGIFWLGSISLNAVVVMRMFLFLCQGKGQDRGATAHLDLRPTEATLSIAVFCFLLISALGTAHL
jgi:NADH:ubiquinone oxidoreductase subunit 4 (subunit M)